MLPSVDEVLSDNRIVEIINEYPRSLVLESVREVIDLKRQFILRLKEDASNSVTIEFGEIIESAIERVKLNYSLSLKKVINATGTVIHTNLGRSLLSEDIKYELWCAASRYSNLEYDLDNGERGSRYSHLTSTIKRLTGAEDVLVVNNNAAAVLLVLSTMAKGGEAIVSRGELVEVGGSFRIPSIMALSGAELVEVGSTNKTHLKDYKEAITEDTNVLMKVHTSNYRIMGFTESVSIEELVNLGKKYKLPVIEDLGSGVFIDLSKYGLSYEPTVLDSIRQGADVVTFSGDKMLGGPQAGIIVGKKEYIEKMKKNQLTRALRVDKLTICALEATLRMYLDETKAIENIPTLKMLTYKIEELEVKANKLFEKITALNLNANINIEDGFSQVGGGSMPLETISTKVISITPEHMNVSSLEKKLRLSEAHIIARVYDNKYVLDVRTIFDDEFDVIVEELRKAFN
ncbi:L-seryl-tRNA(Sec) selenium transferase [Clostridioides difficile]|uniref:L-seryl-tRNA(Sec) selenium transferase n=1 Tax=Clostridioides difficile TaxID=1496 RepID=UPI0003F98D98|nr:L-seryl-tRNA(Sec) selenium transferase [Clostridioides difficile]MBZ0797868.1 L-seryl-tRNA(Sec) selenium transferase [Clostridioides difficile]MBZ4434536.1 L-seryl-tRNA(Sec) selenium transferase [Clostridioides difficile]MCK8741465.1 L-seryl-tRNA(Sec) selenium transferase [Clostridioides difficile]MDI6240224.1 L-seryl-tRNA(Sec) selenium transferase [Clostridioides difficile]MDM9731136.1 L-seryl-tRNA(Sec) selenium transferase [Clostridioides difficile]